MRRPKEFELKVFEGCMPFEEMPEEEKKTLLFGPMKPVGLEKPDGTRPYAVVQLRQDNLSASMYNVVGFQTHLTFPEQRRILRMIPGLQNAEIIRYGVMHKNTFLNAPLILNEYYQMKNDLRIFVAGQLSGVEGYVESIGSGLVAGLNMANLVRGNAFGSVSDRDRTRSSCHYLAHTDPRFFQPMNINHGVFSAHFGEVTHKRTRKSLFAERSLSALQKLVGGRIPFDQR